MTYLENTLCIMSALEDANKYYSNYLRAKYSLKANESALYYSLASESFSNKVKQFISKVILYIIALFKRVKDYVYKIFDKIREILKKIKRFYDIKRGKEFKFYLDPKPIIEIVKIINSEIQSVDLRSLTKSVLDFAKNIDKNVSTYGGYTGPNKSQYENLSFYSYNVNKNGDKEIEKLEDKIDDYKEELYDHLKEFYNKLLNLLEPIEFDIIETREAFKAYDYMYDIIEDNLNKYRNFLDNLETEIVTFTKNSLEIPPVISNVRRIGYILVGGYIFNISRIYDILQKYFLSYWNSFSSKYDKELIKEKADELKESCLNNIRKYKSDVY